MEGANTYQSSRYRSYSRKGLYRSKRGMILGVCRGLSDYFDFPVFWLRVITIGLFIFTGFWPTGVLYIVGAFLMKSAPSHTCETPEAKGAYRSSDYSGDIKNDHIRRRCSNLERRLRRLESSVTTPEYDWESRLNS